MAVLPSVRDRHSVMYIDRGQSNQGFELVANTGRRSSLQANVSGKLLLALSLRSLTSQHDHRTRRVPHRIGSHPRTRLTGWRREP
jgi:DNA-binding IclR family transcriptional regulator